jgi:hypothetical protein
MRGYLTRFHYLKAQLVQLVQLDVQVQLVHAVFKGTQVILAQ